MRKIIPLLALPLFLLSCGLSENERNAINIEIQNAQRNQQILQTNLSDAKAQLAVEYDKMTQVKEFHFLRTDAERDEQIKNQSLRIDSVQKQIQVIQNNIYATTNQINALEAQLNK